MAITDIHPIHVTLHKAIDYILDKNKTDNGILVSTFGCTADGHTAEKEFEDIKLQGTGKTTVLAQHLVQSFEPGEVTPELVHQIGLQLAEKLLENSYQYVLTTHIDKDHIHNHLIFNEVDFINFRSFEWQQNRGGKVFEKIRKISDELCEENNLSVIKNPELGKGKSHYEWEMDKQGKSWKSQLKYEIDNTIMESDTFDDFLAKIRAKNIEVIYKPENVIKIKFRMPGQTEFARGKTLGWYYDEPQIKRRIEQYYLLRTGKRQTPKKSKLIDTSQEKFQNSKYLERWADIKNMQEVSKLINLLSEHNVSSQEELENKAIERYGERVKLVGDLNAISRDIGDVDDSIKLLQAYMKYKPVNDDYKASKNKKKFATVHEKELRKYDKIKEDLLVRYPNRKLPNLERLYTRKAELITKCKEKNSEYKKIVAELEKLDNARTTIQEYLNKSNEQNKKNRGQNL